MGEVSNGGLPQVGRDQPAAPGGLGPRGTSRAFGVEGNAASTGGFMRGIAPQSRSQQNIVGRSQIVQTAGTVITVSPRMGGGTANNSAPNGAMLPLRRRGSGGSTGPTT